MSNLALVKSATFGNVHCDFYSDDKEIWMTREQIGMALEYSDPATAIAKIHNRYRDRLDKFSTYTKLVGVEGERTVQREVVVYNAKGIYEICRWSRQPKADAFFDWVYEILEGLRTRKMNLQSVKPHEQKKMGFETHLPKTYISDALPENLRILELEYQIRSARIREAEILLQILNQYPAAIGAENIAKHIVHTLTGKEFILSSAKVNIATKPTNIGKYIKEKREKSGLRIIDLAVKSGVSAGQISRIETGVTRNPRLTTVQNLIETLEGANKSAPTIKGINVQVLFDLSDMFNLNPNKFRTVKEFHEALVDRISQRKAAKILQDIQKMKYHKEEDSDIQHLIELLQRKAENSYIN
jgi:prophage antirepressor-like protein/transcriptional regulator with XRE-family HTH domain